MTAAMIARCADAITRLSDATLSSIAYDDLFALATFPDHALGVPFTDHIAARKMARARLMERFATLSDGDIWAIKSCAYALLYNRYEPRIDQFIYDSCVMELTARGAMV